MLTLADQIVENTGSTSENAANFIFEHSSSIIAFMVILVALVIALSVFLAILWKYYKKDELILKKYKINSANEDIEELKKLDTKL